MQNTYDKMLKYLIAHDINFSTSIKENDIVVVFLRHKNRYTLDKIHKSEFVLIDEKNFVWIISEMVSRIFPSFKDFDTPIKVS